MSNMPQWLTLLLAAMAGAVSAVALLIRLGFSFNSRLQRIENQDLNQMIDARIEDWFERKALTFQERVDARVSADWHDHRTPMLTERVFRPIDKIEEEQWKQGQNIAVLMERDRIGGAIDRLASTVATSTASAARKPSA